MLGLCAIRQVLYDRLYMYRPMCDASWFLLDILCCPSIVCDVRNVHAYGCLTTKVVLEPRGRSTG